MGMMRAKFRVLGVESFGEPKSFETVTMQPVTGRDPFGPNGESDDNTFSRWTPSGSLTLTITNPDLFDKFRLGQKFYSDFTEAPE